LEPDFVKIDRHFVHEIDRAIVKRNLVDSIATACHRLGIQVIAEGIEDEEDLNAVLDMGIDFVQGYGLARPKPELLPDGFRFRMPRRESEGGNEKELRFIGEIARDCPTLPPSATIHTARALFNSKPAIMSLPVVESDRVVAMIHRRPFFERVISGRLGYGESLAAYKNLGQITYNAPFLCVDSRDTLEETSNRLAGRCVEERYNDICVTSNGKYLGTVEVSALLAAITQRSLDLARGANPLSGLPGNEAIRREIELRIAQNKHFDCCYIDIDNFKPFNDAYGFERGDAVLRQLADAVREAIREEGSGEDFAGHIGGDDFIVISRPQNALAVCQDIIEQLQGALPRFHDRRDYENGFYKALNRVGEEESFALMSLSVGVVSTEVNQFKSFAELASIASEVKKAAKSHEGTCVVRDRRLQRTEVMTG
jgi:diguanylate cyclase (GGDEF)-like protein